MYLCFISTFLFFFLFFFNDPATTEIYTLSLHDALPISLARTLEAVMAVVRRAARELTRADGATFILRDADKCFYADERSEEHTSELQSRVDLVCRLLLEKKKKKKNI